MTESASQSPSESPSTDAGQPAGDPSPVEAESPRVELAPGSEAAARTLRGYLDAAEVEWEEIALGVFTVDLPGTRKLTTPVRLDVGAHAVAVHAFVCRQPDENHEGVYRWMLEKNLRTYAVSFALDHAGDIYLDGRLPLASVTDEELDRVLGSVLEYSDGSFNTLLELGFAGSIRKEWEWRRSRGESTKNLEAFRGWLEGEHSPGQ